MMAIGFDYPGGTHALAVMLPALAPRLVRPWRRPAASVRSIAGLRRALYARRACAGLGCVGCPETRYIICGSIDDEGPRARSESLEAPGGERPASLTGL
jgi:hypothetical protein